MTQERHDPLLPNLLTEKAKTVQYEVKVSSVVFPGEIKIQHISLCVVDVLFGLVFSPLLCVPLQPCTALSFLFHFYGELWLRHFLLICL